MRILHPAQAPTEDISRDRRSGIQVDRPASFLDDEKSARDGHSAPMGYVIANEISASIVRWHRHRRVERFLQELYSIAKPTYPEGLFCYANCRTAKYRELEFMDMACFNVYLELQLNFQAHVARLQTELGLDSRGNRQAHQARGIDWPLRSAFQGGRTAAFVFAWTDYWYSRGKDADDWDCGLTDRSQAPKPALTAVHDTDSEVRWPRIPVLEQLEETGGGLEQFAELIAAAADRVLPARAAWGGAAG
jgi:hypothetical protein